MNITSKQTMMESYFVYMTINNFDDTKCYIGFTNGHRKNYLGSGLLIIKAVKKYGRNNFSKIILGEFKNREEAHFWEGFYIKLYKTEVKYRGYNISPNGGIGTPGCFSEETKRKISESNLGLKRSEITKQRLRESSIGKHQSEETIEKRRKKNIGKKYKTKISK